MKQNAVEINGDLAPTKSHRRSLFKIHSWVGFHFAVLMFVVLATGTIATLSNEIDWLLNDALRVTPSDDRVSWQTMTEAIKQHDPSLNIHTFQKMSGDYLAYRATVSDELGNRYYLYVDQWTGKVTGTTGLLTVQRFFRDFHRYLFMPSIIGLPIVASMAFVLAISLYTGLKTSRNWRTLMTRVRLNKGTRVFIGDAHKAAGLWSIWFFVLVIFTSVWYLAELGGNINARFGGQSFEPSRPNLSQERVKSFGDVVNIRSTEDILQATKAVFPELDATEIFYPIKPNQGITVLGDRRNPILRSRANRIFFDPESLEPLKIQRSEDIGIVAWINEVADPLHFGYFGGITTKLIWFIFGLAMTGLSASGVWLTWRRLKSSAISKTQFATMPVIGIGLLIAYFAWYPNYKNTLDEAPKLEKALQPLVDGNISIEGYLGIGNGDDTAKPDGSVRLVISAENGWPNLQQITLSLDTGESKESNEITVKSIFYNTNTVIKPKFDKALLAKAKSMTAKVSLHSGRNLIFNWPLNM